MVDRTRIRGRWGSGPGDFSDVRLDGNTEATLTIDYPHHEIHGGSAYSAHYLVTHGSGSSPNILIVTPDSEKTPHFRYFAVSDGILALCFFEEADYAGGVSLPAYNRNRRSSNTSILTLTTNATDSGGGKGTEIWAYKAGANKIVTATSAFGDAEFLLKANSKYLIEAVGTNGDEITLLIGWYEHTARH